jgi:hypothetical protein
VKRALIVLVLLLACMAIYTLVNQREKNRHEPMVCASAAMAEDDLSFPPGIRVFTGTCRDVSGGSFSYTIAGKWNEKDKTAEEYLSVTIGDKRYTGAVKSACPSDPWTQDIICTPILTKGDALRYYRPDSFPITGGTGK